MRTAVIAVLFNFLMASAHADEQKNLALIYVGPGACKGCSEPFAQLVRPFGLQPKYVHSRDITPELLDRAAIYIQPGGDDTMLLRRDFTDKQMQTIRDYIFHGGRYLGVCLGGYWAGRWADDENRHEALGVVPAEPRGENPYPVGSKKDPKNDAVVPVRWKGSLRYMYFQEGPEFDLFPDADVEIYGRYEDGNVAAFMTRYGDGKVAVSGVHFEATPDWYSDYHLNDPDGLDADLGLAMIGDLLKSIAVGPVGFKPDCE